MSTRTAVERAWLALAVVLALLGVTTTALWWGSRPPPDVGPAPSAVTAAAAPDGPTTPTEQDSAAPRDDGGVLPSGVVARPAVAPAPEAVVAPVTLFVERLGTEVPVLPVGATEDGDVEVPRDADEVGWYRFGAAPGAQAGSAVLVGHVDTVGEGPGALFGLREAEVGDAVEVGLADGTRLRYAVTSRTSIDKAQLPVDDLFARDGAHRLVLVTCGGRWLPESRSYTDNVVVVAEPLP